MISIVNITAENIHRFLDDILEIERSSFPSPWSRTAFHQETTRRVSHFWALLAGGSFIGYICFWMFSGEIHLMNIAIHPKKRGKGLGSHLLDKMIELGRSKGAETAWLEVRPSNLVARFLYKKAGFKETGRRPRYYNDTNEDAIVMSMSLLPNRANRLEPDGICQTNPIPL
jgi:ribosomal-protein-alanine N-acetyltransferase